MIFAYHLTSLSESGEVVLIYKVQFTVYVYIQNIWTVSASSLGLSHRHHRHIQGLMGLLSIALGITGVMVQVTSPVDGCFGVDLIGMALCVTGMRGCNLALYADSVIHSG